MGFQSSKVGNGCVWATSGSTERSSINADHVREKGFGRKRSVQAWSARILLVSLVTLAGCSSTGTTDEQASSAASSSVNDEHAQDEALLAELQTHTTAWNEVLAPVVADYLDPNVEAKNWVADAGPVIGQLEPKIRAMGKIAVQINNGDLQRDVMAIIETYQAKLAAFAKLVNAVAAGDQDAEQSAQADLNAASQEGTRLAKEMMASFGS